LILPFAFAERHDKAPDVPFDSGDSVQVSPESEPPREFRVPPGRIRQEHTEHPIGIHHGKTIDAVARPCFGKVYIY
jgi:hypothetical protein